LAAGGGDAGAAHRAHRHVAQRPSGQSGEHKPRSGHLAEREAVDGELGILDVGVRTCNHRWARVSRGEPYIADGRRSFPFGPDIAQRPNDSGESTSGGPASSPTAGQLQEVVGDDARARILYRRVMQHKDAAGPAELGRAALHLGRLELRAGQPAQGRKNVRLAYDLALKNADAMLYAEAVPTLIVSLLEAGREPDAAAVVQEARARYSRLGHIDAFKADLERRWGASRVATWWA
jgi:hypothetical protein